MDGLLVIDKPSGPTSHEVVARVRRALGERRIGHTGTLDPAATGVLPLVLGRATRLARFLSASDKSYEAVVRLGVATDTHDGAGTPAGPSYQARCRHARRSIGRSTRSAARFCSSHRRTRRRRSAAAAATVWRARQRVRPEMGFNVPPLAPGPSSSRAASRRTASFWCSVEGDRVTLNVSCSAGFYVRALAHDLGVRLGIGAHLLALRRTRSGDATLDDAVALDAIEREPALRRPRHRASFADAAGAVLGHADERRGPPRRPRTRSRVPLTPKKGSESFPGDSPEKTADPFCPAARSGWRSGRDRYAGRAYPGFCTLPLFWCNMLILFD